MITVEMVVDEGKKKANIICSKCEYFKKKECDATTDRQCYSLEDVKFNQALSLKVSEEKLRELGYMKMTTYSDADLNMRVEHGIDLKMTEQETWIKSLKKVYEEDCHKDITHFIRECAVTCASLKIQALDFIKNKDPLDNKYPQNEEFFKLQGYIKKEDVELDVEKVEKLVDLKLSQLLIKDEPDRHGYTYSKVIAEAICNSKDVIK